MRSIVFTIVLILSGNIYGQNVLPPSLYLMNQTMMNPAYAGMHDHANITAISRGQWLGVEGAPFTHILMGSYTFSYQGAAGFSLVKDSYGINSDTEIKVHYSYRIEMLNAVLSFGLQGGYAIFSEDPSKLNAEVSDDPLLGSGKITSTSPAFGLGMMYKTKRFYLGLGIPRITGTDVETTELFSKSVSPVYNLSGGLFISLLNGLMVKPSFLMSYQDDQLLADINGQLLVANKVWLGVSLRNLNSAGFNLVFSEDDAYHFGYSFHLPVNDLDAASWGTHELMVSIDLKFSKRNELKQRYF